MAEGLVAAAVVSGPSFGAVGSSWSPPGEGLPSRTAVEGPGLAVALGTAYLALAGLLAVVDRELCSRRADGGRHLASCRRGLWVDGYSGGDGAPCSAWCVEVGGAYLLARSVLLGERG